MPQIDFGKAFANDDDQPSPKRDLLFQPPGPSPAEPVELSRFRQTRLGRSDWTNIIFVVIAVLGGLFLAFYFFNGAEVLRSAAAWPGELLYGRPFAPIDNNNKAEIASPNPVPVQLVTEQTDARAPFDQVAGATGANELPAMTSAFAAPLPNNSSIPTASVDLPVPAPAGDALLTALDQTAAEVAGEGSAVEQQSTAVVHNVVQKSKRRISSTRQTAKKTVSNVTAARNATTSATDPNFKVDPRLHVDTSPASSTIGGEGGFHSGPGGSLGNAGLGGGVIRSVGIGPGPIGGLLGGRH